MRMMGMSDSAYFVSWLVFFLIQVAWVTIVCTLILSIFVAKQSTFLIIFLFIFLYGMSLFGYITAFVALFKNVKTASAATIILHLATFYVKYAVPRSAGITTKILVSILPNLNLSFGSDVYWSLDLNGGAKFNNLGTTYLNYSMVWYMVMGVFNFFFWLGIGLYLTYTLPTEFGIRKGPCFCFSPSTYCRRSRKK